MNAREEDKAIEDVIRRGVASPLTRYRVTLVCDCYADAAYGYGPTRESALNRAVRHFRRAHGPRAKVGETIVEEALTGHYEEIES